MADLDLTTLSLPELKQLEKDVARAIASFETRRLTAARTEVEELAKRLGFSFSELADLIPAKKKSVGEAKYRNPENPDQTWSGRGRKPNWLVEALAAGGTLDDFAI